LSQARDGAARTTSAWIHPDDANTPCGLPCQQTNLAEEPAGVAIEGRLTTTSQKEKEEK
jgi:hypothetical protein